MLRPALKRKRNIIGNNKIDITLVTVGHTYSWFYKGIYGRLYQQYMQIFPALISYAD